jgi:hypothetical protein
MKEDCKKDCYDCALLLYPGRGEGKRSIGMGEIPEEGCPTPEEDRVIGGTELNVGTDSQRRENVNWVPGILDPKSRISKTQHH